MIPVVSLFMILFFSFLRFIVAIACYLKDSKKIFMQSLSLYASCLCSMLLNDEIVDIQKPDGICSPTFVANDFSGIFLHPFIFSIKYSRSA